MKRSTEIKLRKLVERIIREETGFNPMSISRILKEAGIPFITVRRNSKEEYVIQSGIDMKIGSKWEKYEDSVYTALEQAGWKGEDDPISIYIE